MVKTIIFSLTTLLNLHGSLLATSQRRENAISIDDNWRFT